MPIRVPSHLLPALRALQEHRIADVSMAEERALRGFGLVDYQGNPARPGREALWGEDASPAPAPRGLFEILNGMGALVVREKEAIRINLPNGDHLWDSAWPTLNAIERLIGWARAVPVPGEWAVDLLPEEAAKLRAGLPPETVAARAAMVESGTVPGGWICCVARTDVVERVAPVPGLFELLDKSGAKVERTPDCLTIVVHDGADAFDARGGEWPTFEVVKNLVTWASGLQLNKPWALDLTPTEWAVLAPELNRKLRSMARDDEAPVVEIDDSQPPRDGEVTIAGVPIVVREVDRRGFLDGAAVQRLSQSAGTRTDQELLEQLRHTQERLARTESKPVKDSNEQAPEAEPPGARSVLLGAPLGDIEAELRRRADIRQGVEAERDANLLRRAADLVYTVCHGAPPGGDDVFRLEAVARETLDPLTKMRVFGPPTTPRPALALMNLESLRAEAGEHRTAMLALKTLWGILGVKPGETLLMAGRRVISERDSLRARVEADDNGDIQFGIPEKMRLWSAVNDYVSACGGDTGGEISTPIRREARDRVEHTVAFLIRTNKRSGRCVASENDVLDKLRSILTVTEGSPIHRAGYAPTTPMQVADVVKLAERAMRGWAREAEALTAIRREIGEGMTSTPEALAAKVSVLAKRHTVGANGAAAVAELGRTREALGYPAKKDDLAEDTDTLAARVVRERDQALQRARVAEQRLVSLPTDEQVQTLWAGIDAYVAACGGTVGERSPARWNAVQRVKRALDLITYREGPAAPSEAQQEPNTMEGTHR